MGLSQKRLALVLVFNEMVKIPTVLLAHFFQALLKRLFLLLQGRSFALDDFADSVTFRVGFLLQLDFVLRLCSVKVHFGTIQLCTNTSDLSLKLSTDNVNLMIGSLNVCL